MKFILILTGILLGLALLLVLLVLFCPVRYSAEAVKKPGNIRDAAARVRISWLFGGISVRFLMRQDKRKSDLRIFEYPCPDSFIKKRKNVPQRRAGRRRMEQLRQRNRKHMWNLRPGWKICRRQDV